LLVEFFISHVVSTERRARIRQLTGYLSLNRRSMHRLWIWQLIQLRTWRKVYVNLAVINGAASEIVHPQIKHTNMLP
jgi:hypothetical protein